MPSHRSDITKGTKMTACGGRSGGRGHSPGWAEPRHSVVQRNCELEPPSYPSQECDNIPLQLGSSNLGTQAYRQGSVIFPANRGT
jgi:hypothetical protein